MCVFFFIILLYKSYFVKYMTDNTINQHKFVVCMTTTLCRIEHIQPVLLRILKEQLDITNYTYTFYLFIPSIISSYIPTWLLHISNIYPHFHVIYCTKDYGPITKLLPLFLEVLPKKYNPDEIQSFITHNNFWIITIDDDILYDNRFLFSIFTHICALNQTHKSSNTDYNAFGFSCIKWFPSSNSFIPSTKYERLYSNDNTNYSLIIEGYMGAIYNLACFYPFDNFITYVNNTSGANISCLRSDDLVISSFLSTNRHIPIQQIQSRFWHKDFFWNNRKSILMKHGQSHDALHNKNDTFSRYQNASLHIQSILTQVNSLSK